jgi:hypothetical protein
MTVALKRGYTIEVISDKPSGIKDIVVLGNYSKSNYKATQIVSIYGLVPTIRENHGQVTGIEVRK